MKQIIIFLLLSLFPFLLTAQSSETLKSIEFKTAADYKTYEPEIAEAADFLLNTVQNESEYNGSLAAQIVIEWMTGTPDYTFEIGADFIDCCGGNPSLGSVYMASLVKAAVSAKDLTTTAINTKAKEIFLKYCAVEENNVKHNKFIKKGLKKMKKS